MITTASQLFNLGLRIDICCTLPKKTAAAEAMVAYGTVRGKTASFRFGGGLPGKTFKVTSNKSTTTTEKTCTFKFTDFADPERPTLAEIVAALETAFHEAAHVVPSSGALGELVLTGEAAADAKLTIGDGTANEILGFPKYGYVIDNAGGAGTVAITLPAEVIYPYDEWVYSLVPREHVYTFTVATGVLDQLARTTGYEVKWTPSTRKLTFADGSGDVARAIRAAILL